MEPPASTKNLLTFYAGQNGIAVVVCPTCGLSKEVDALKTGIARKKVKATCRKCKSKFQFTIEIRTIYRKNVQLTGQCEHLKSHKREIIQVSDL